jgi:ribosomal protein L21
MHRLSYSSGLRLAGCGGNGPGKHSARRRHPKIGKGKIAGASVEGEIVGEVKGDKLVVFKFRRRKRSRKKNGHRQHYTAVKITKVTG